MIRLSSKDFSFDNEWKKKMLNNLVSSWFSSNRSIERIKRGTDNEDTIMDALRKLDFILCFFESRMLSHKSIL